MANFDQRIGHFQDALKDFTKEQSQPLQEANCSQHMKGAEAFEISDFLVSEDHDGGDQSFADFKTGTSGPSSQLEYARASPSNSPCIQGIQLDNSSIVIQTHGPLDTL